MPYAAPPSHPAQPSPEPLIAAVHRMVEDGHLAAGPGLIDQVRQTLAGAPAETAETLPLRLCEARLLIALGRWAEAQVAGADVLADLVRHGGADHPLTVRLRIELLDLLLDAGDEPAITAAIAVARSALQGLPMAPVSWRIELDLYAAAAMCLHGRPEEAVEALSALRSELFDRGLASRADRRLAVQVVSWLGRATCRPDQEEASLALQTDAISRCAGLVEEDPADLGCLRLQALGESRRLHWLLDRSGAASDPATRAAVATLAALRERLHAIDPANDRWTRDRLLGLRRQADLARLQDDRPAASALLREAVALGEALLQRNPGNPRSQAELAGALISLWRIEHPSCDPDACHPLALRAADLFEAAAWRDPARREVTTHTLSCLAVTAGHLASWRSETAGDLHRRWVALAASLAARPGAPDDDRRRLAQAHIALADHLAEHGDPEDGLLHARAAGQIATRLLGEVAAEQRDRATMLILDSHFAILRLLQAADDTAAEVETLLTASRQLIDAVDAGSTGEAGRRLGFLRVLRWDQFACTQAERRGDHATACARLDAGLARARAWLASQPTDVGLRFGFAELLVRRIQLAAQAGDAAALPWGEECLAVLREAPADNCQLQQMLANNIDDHALRLFRLGRGPEAIALQGEAIAILTRLRKRYPGHADLRANLTLCLKRATRTARMAGDAGLARTRLEQLEALAASDPDRDAARCTVLIERVDVLQGQDHASDELRDLRRELVALLRSGRIAGDQRRRLALTLGDLALDPASPGRLALCDEAVELLEALHTEQAVAERANELACSGYRLRAHVAQKLGGDDPERIAADLDRACSCHAWAVQADDDPCLAADWADTLARRSRFRSRGGDGAGALADAALAVDLLRTVCAGPRPTPQMRVCLVHALEILAACHHASGSRMAAIAGLRERIQAAEQALAAEATPAGVRLLAACRRETVHALIEAGRAGEALPLAAITLAAAHTACADVSAGWPARQDLALGWIRLAEALLHATPPAPSLGIAEQAEREARALCTLAANQADSDRALAILVDALEQQALALAGLGRPAEASGLLSSQLDRFEAWLAGQPDAPIDAGWSVARLADLLASQHFTAEAPAEGLAALRRSQAILRWLIGRDPTDLKALQTLADTHATAGRHERDRGATEAARDDLVRAEALLTRFRAAAPPGCEPEPRIISRLDRLRHLLEGATP